MEIDFDKDKRIREYVFYVVLYLRSKLLCFRLRCRMITLFSESTINRHFYITAKQLGTSIMGAIDILLKCDALSITRVYHLME